MIRRKRGHAKFPTPHEPEGWDFTVLRPKTDKFSYISADDTSKYMYIEKYTSIHFNGSIYQRMFNSLINYIVPVSNHWRIPRFLARVSCPRPWARQTLGDGIKQNNLCMVGKKTRYNTKYKIIKMTNFCCRK